MDDDRMQTLTRAMPDGAARQGVVGVDRDESSASTEKR